MAAYGILVPRVQVRILVPQLTIISGGRGASPSCFQHSPPRLPACRRRRLLPPSGFAGFPPGEMAADCCRTLPVPSLLRLSDESLADATARPLTRPCDTFQRQIIGQTASAGRAEARLTTLRTHPKRPADAGIFLLPPGRKKEFFVNFCKQVEECGKIYLHLHHCV